jgi:DNA-binding protein H-NS
MPSLQSINAKIEKLRKQAEAVAQRDRANAIQKVLRLMHQLDLTVADLPAARGRRGRGAGAGGTKGAAKYRDPESGKTWTGHGRAPEWIKNAGNRDDFLIDKAGAGSGESSAAKGSARRAKASNGTRATAKRAAKGAAAKTGRKSAKARKARAAEAEGAS